MSKLVCWALFDSETGDYMSTVHKYFEDKIDVYGVGMSHYGKDTPNYLNFNFQTSLLQVLHARAGAI